MKAILNILEIIETSWTIIVIILALGLGVFRKIKNFLNLSKEQQINAALEAIKNQLLKMMSDAEIEWKYYKKSGMLKKSQVITEIYEKYPILTKYKDQDRMIELITQMIDEEMDEMNRIINGIETS